MSLIDLKYKGEKILPIGVVPIGYANAGAPLYRVEGTFFNEKKDRIVIYEHYTVANCQANCPIKYATYWGDNTLRFYETKEEIKLLHLKKEPTVITLSDDTYTITTISYYPNHYNKHHRHRYYYPDCSYPNCYYSFR